MTFTPLNGNYSVIPGITYLGWCLEYDVPTNGGALHEDRLFSTYGTNLPDNAQFYRDELTPIVQQAGPPALNDPIPWGSLNYLLNNKQGTAQEVQTAIWLLIWGAIPGDWTVTNNVDTMVTNARANNNFIPVSGEIIAVLLYNDGIGHVVPPPGQPQSQEIVIELTVPNYDLGDLPQPPAPPTYPTLFTTGPSHQLLPGQTLFLGACVDAELDGQPDPLAGGDPVTGGDDNAVGSPVFGNQQCDDDEDGVVRPTDFNWTTATGGRVNVTVAGGPGCLSGWIDWNGNGDLTDDGDNVLNNVPLNTGTSLQTFGVPASVNPASGTFYARFRLYAPDIVNESPVCQTPRLPTGPAINGEVEDYRWSFGPNAVTLTDLQATTVSTGERLMAMLRSWLQR